MKSAKCCLIALSVVLVPLYALAGVSRFDDTFDDADWEHFAITSQNGASFTTNQSPAGGNPGSYQMGTHGLPATTPNFVNVGHVFIGGPTYDPAIEGAIASIEFSYDFIVSEITNAGPDVGHGLLLRQDGAFYGIQSPVANFGEGWRGVSNSGLTAADFNRMGSSSTGIPDFTSAGGPIEFGYFTFNGAPASGVGASQKIWGIDNYSATVEPVPEPSTISLLLVAVVLRLLGSRGRGQVQNAM